MRSFFEPRFGTDFSGVKIHTDSNANHLARSVSAKAFTVGRNVVFGSGQYSPETSGGKSLIAHELTHVVQQGGAPSLQSKHLLRKKREGPVSSELMINNGSVQTGLSGNHIHINNKTNTPKLQGGFFGDLWEGAKSVGRSAWSGIKSVGQSIGRGASSAWSWIKGVGQSIGRGASSAWNWIKGVGRSIGKGASSAWEWIKGVGRSIGRGASSAWNWIKGVGRSIGKGLFAAWNWIKGVGRAIGKGLAATWEFIKRIGHAIGRGLIAAWNWLKRAGGVAWECIKGFFAGAQPKLIINKTGDAYEQEADRVAAKVLQMKLSDTKNDRKRPSPANNPFGKSADKPVAAEIKRKVNVNQNLAQPLIQRYSDDIHFKMTLQEAANVGYNAVEAGTVAFEDQAVDTGWRHPWISTPREIFNPRVSGKDMLHFPARSVATGDLRSAIRACDIKAFGAGLHRFQDTYSHNFTTWKIPTRRLCSSLCWKFNPLLAAAILLPNPASGRRAALKHICLGFYPDEHHGEQKGRDAAMKRSTRAWLLDFKNKCRQEGTSGPGVPSGSGGSSATPSPSVTFTVTSYNSTGSGNANLAESASGLTVRSPTVRAIGNVMVTGDDTEAKKWDVGFIQTVYSPYDIESKYEKTFSRVRKSSLPLRDAIAGTPQPWYSTSAFSRVAGTGTTNTESMNDTPSHRGISWNDPRVTNPNSLERYERNFSAVKWLIARRRTDGNIRYLKNSNWGFNFIVDVDKTKSVGSKGTNSGRGMDGISSGDGQGSLTPKLSGTISNNANVYTLVPRPPWP